MDGEDRRPTSVESPAGPDAGRRVVEMDPDVDRRWGAFIDTCAARSIYHHPAWLEVLHRAFGYPTVCLACVDEAGDVVGVLPLMRTRGVVRGRGLTLLPRMHFAATLFLAVRAAAAPR